MAKSTNLPRTQRPREASLLQALSTIQKSPSSQSIDGKVPSRQPSHRRATVSGPAPTAGILKSHNDKDIPATPSLRVSFFSSREDGSIRNNIASFDVDASPKEYTMHCAKEIRRPSLRDVMLLPPSSLPFGTPASSMSSSRPVRRYSTMEIAKDQEAAARSEGKMQSYSEVRNDYSLGDVARCASHMIIPDDPQEAFGQVSQLKQYVFAFVKRTDGLWTYAILAHSFVDDEGEECMMFVMNQRGSTKTITKKKWVSFVRLVADKMVME